MFNDTAVIFDLDGTMIDNNSFHLKAWQQFYKKETERLPKKNTKNILTAKQILMYWTMFLNKHYPNRKVTVTQMKKKNYTAAFTNLILNL